MDTGHTSKRELTRLTEAFEAFNQLSGELQQSYDELQSEVARLQAQLQTANRQRDEEIQRHTRLAKRLEALLEALPGGVIMLDHDGIVRERNSAANDFLGQPLQDTRWTLVCRRAFQDDMNDQGDLTLQDGRMVSLAEKDMNPGPGRVLLFTDVTEHRKVQDLLARQRRLAAMGEMAAALAHQIRTPLSAALLYLSNTMYSGLSHDRKDELLEKSSRCLHTLEQLISDMLHFARGARYTETTFELDDLLETIEVALGPVMLDTQSATVHGPDQAATLIGNREALAGAVLNLATNGLHHAGANARLDIEARICGLDVEIRVSDNGPGVPEQNRDRIFEPFFTSRSDGTGLGLAVARSVALAHRGELRLDTRTPDGPASRNPSSMDPSSMENLTGASFIMRLPLSATPQNTTSLTHRTTTRVDRLPAAACAAHTQAKEAAV